LLLLLFHRDRSVQQVDMTTAKAEQFTKTESYEASEQDEGPETVGHPLSEFEHLGRRRLWSFGRPLDSGAFNAARIAHEQFVVNCRREDRTEEPVGLRRHRR